MKNLQVKLANYQWRFIKMSPNPLSCTKWLKNPRHHRPCSIHVSRIICVPSRWLLTVLKNDPVMEIIRSVSRSDLTKAWFKHFTRLLSGNVLSVLVTPKSISSTVLNQFEGLIDFQLRTFNQFSMIADAEESESEESDEDEDEDTDDIGRNRGLRKLWYWFRLRIELLTRYFYNRDTLLK